MSENGQKHYDLTVRGRRFEGGTHVMGILNADPQSFFEGSRALGIESAVSRAGAMLAEGAEILDVGGQSTRPGASVLPADEEEARVVPVIRALRVAYPSAILSVDTFYASVAAAAAEAGADMINDVSCLADEHMPALIAHFGLAAVVMHNRRGSKTRDMFEDKIKGLELAVQKLRAAGVREDKIMLDGGIGFNLSRDEDVELLARYGELIQHFDLPLLLGASRKSFLGGERADDRLPATLNTTALATKTGALFVRVHDVAENVRAIRETVREMH